MLARRVQLSTLVLATLAIFDMVTTVMLLSQGYGESNPIFSPFVAYGSAAFIAAKLLFLVIPILLLEYVRTKKPMSAEQGTWIAAGFYGMLYVLHLVRYMV